MGLETLNVRFFPFREWTPYRDQMEQYLLQGVTIRAISKIITPVMNEPVGYNSFLFYIKNDLELKKALLANSDK